MRLIDRYICREFWPFFIIALGATVFVLILSRLLRFIDFVLRNHLDFATFVRFLAYTLPTISGLALPIAFLLACILTFNRLSADHEYVVLKASGLSLYRLLAPLVVIAIVIYGLSSFALMYGAPWGFQGLRRLVFEVARSQAHYHFRPGEFNDTFKGFVLYAERIEPERRRLEGIFIADTRTDTSQVITARRGEFVARPNTLEVMLELQDGAIHRHTPTQKRYHLLRFGRYTVRLDLDTHLARQATRGRRPRELFPSQLQREIQRQQGTGKVYRRLLLYWHTTMALPFAAIIFAGLGPVLGIVQTRASRAGGYVLGLLAVFVYYIFLTLSTALGEEMAFPPLLAAWLPNLCMGGLTVLWLRRANRGVSLLGESACLEVPRHLWRRWVVRSDRPLP